MLFVATANAQSVTKLGTVPNSDPGHPSGLTIGDEYTFIAIPGQRVNISVDTRDDTDEGTSNLDPVVILKDQNHNVVAYADDNASCSRAPVCGYACPSIASFQIPPTVPPNSKWTIVVRDFNGAGIPHCTGGAYNLTVSEEIPYLGTVVRTLTQKTDDGAVGDPPGFQQRLDAVKGTGR